VKLVGINIIKNSHFFTIMNQYDSETSINPHQLKMIKKILIF